MPFIGFYVLTLGVLKNGMATVSPIPNLRLQYKYPCYPATFSLIVLWSVGLPGPASGSSPTRGVHMTHTGWTGLRLASLRRWPRDRSCCYCWFWWLVMTCSKGATFCVFTSWMCLPKRHDIFVTSLIRFICSKLVQSSCNSWCSGGCTSLCRTGSTSYTGQECRNPPQKDLEATEHHIHIHHTPYPPRDFSHLQLTKKSPHFHWCAASSIK